MIPLFINISGWECRWETLGFWSQLHLLMKCASPIARNERVNRPVWGVAAGPWYLGVSEGEVRGIWSDWRGLGHLSLQSGSRRAWPWFSYTSAEWMQSLGSCCIHRIVLVAELLFDCPRLPRSHTPCCLAPMKAKEWVYRKRTSSHSWGKISKGHWPFVILEWKQSQKLYTQSSTGNLNTN